MISSNVLLCSSNNPKPKYIVYCQIKKQSIFTYEKLELGNVWNVYWINDFNDLLVIKIVPD